MHSLIGGNYIEAAAEYGGGESERKVGIVMKERRNEVFLVSKCHIRDKNGAEKTINESLKRLNTDHIDLLIFHHVQSEKELEKIMTPGGALEAFEKARSDGKIGFIGISGHGVPDVLIRALDVYDFDAVMTGINFFDRFNFPDVEEVLFPKAVEKGVAIVGVKVLADGLLWEYPEEALRYALRGIDIPKIFLYEGWYDRQLRDRVIRETPDFALRDRLRFWFDNREKAREAYSKLPVKAGACTGCGECIPKCPYNIDIIAKLENWAYKLEREVTSSIPV